jgi:hypothetical protein
VSVIFLSLSPSPSLSPVYSHSDSEGTCLNVTKTRHVKIVGVCRL